MYSSPNELIRIMIQNKNESYVNCEQAEIEAKINILFKNKNTTAIKKLKYNELKGAKQSVLLVKRLSLIVC